MARSGAKKPAPAQKAPRRTPARAGRQAARPKPAKKKAARRKVTTRSHMGHIMSPIVPSLVPSLAFQGEAFPISGIVRLDLTVPDTDRVLIFVTNTGVSGTIMQRLQWNSSAGGATAIDAKQVYTIPTLTAGDTAGGPTSMRAMKCGLSVTCRTPMLERGGLVYVLNTSQRLRAVALPDADGATPGLNRGQADGFFNGIVAHPHTRALDWSDFGKPRHMYGHVVDDPRYNDFDENKGTITNNNFFQHIALGGNSVPLDRPMSTIIIAIDRPSKQQTALFTAMASFYSRWPLDTVAGQNQRKIPTTSHQTHNDIHTGASDHSKAEPSWEKYVEDTAASLGKDVLSMGGELGGLARRRRGGLPRVPRVVP